MNSRSGRLGQEDKNEFYREMAAIWDPGWQPIETAPRDGTEVIVGGLNGIVTIAKYDSAWSHPYWNFDTQELCPWPCEVRNPTHWMPLPKPPSSSSPEGGSP